MTARYGIEHPLIPQPDPTFVWTEPARDVAEAVEHNERVFLYGPNEAAKSAARVTTVPTGQPTPLQVIGPHYSRRVARSREVFVRLIKSGRLRAVRMTERGHWLVYADSVCALLGIKPECQHSRAYYLKRDEEILARMGLL